MKNLKLYLALFLSFTLFYSCEKEPKATCSDGILNGNETEIDCGGDCEQCLSEYIIGNWKMLEARWDGMDAIQGEVFWEITENFIHELNVVLLNDIRYTPNANYSISNNMLVVTDGTESFTYATTFDAPIIELSITLATDTGPILQYLKLEKYTEDLCLNALCDTNQDCHHGYCL